MTTLDLIPFCAKGPLRPYLAGPLICTGGAVATDGEILVYAPDYPGTSPPQELNFTALVDVASRAARELQDGWTKVADIPPMDDAVCDRCNGKGLGVAIPCHDCDGNGTFLHGNLDYECRECDGTGILGWRDAAAGETAVPCGDCDGSGLRDGLSTFRLENDALGIRSRHVERIRAHLPGAELNQHLAEGRYIVFRFSHGVGLVMPCHARPWERA